MLKIIRTLIFIAMLPGTTLAAADEFIDGVWHDERRGTFYVIDSQTGRFDRITPLGDGEMLIAKGTLEIGRKSEQRIFLIVTVEPVYRTVELETDGSLGFWRDHGKKPDKDNRSEYTNFKPAGLNNGINGLWRGTSSRLAIDLDKKIYRSTERGWPAVDGRLELESQDDRVYRLKLFAFEKFRAYWQGDDVIRLANADNSNEHELVRGKLPPEALKALEQQ